MQPGGVFNEVIVLHLVIFSAAESQLVYFTAEASIFSFEHLKQLMLRDNYSLFMDGHVSQF